MRGHNRIVNHKRKLPKFDPMMGKTALYAALALLMVLLAACESEQEAAPTLASLPVVQAKQLATVYISPTPSDAERQATRAAIIPSVSVPTLTPEPTATVYVGVFLQAENVEGDIPIIDATRMLFQPDQTAVPSRCRFEIAEAFGESWRTNANAVRELGCPVEGWQDFGGGLQLFERGVMYYQENGGLWAITTSGGVTGDRFWALPFVPPPGTEEPIDPPPGLQVPIEGFGTMWRLVDGVRDRLGFARLNGQPAEMTLQRFEGGSLLLDKSSGVVYILLNRSSIAFGPY